MPRGDSISRYDGSADLFSIQNAPGKVKTAPIQNKSAPDTISTSEAKKTPAPPKVEPSDFRVPKDRIVEIGKAGRFVFFAIAAPPYLLLYSLPKWVLVSAVPQLFTSMMGVLNHGQSFVQKMLQALYEKLAASLRDLKGMIKWTPTKLEKGELSFFKNALKVLNLPFVKIKDGFKVAQKKAEALLKSFSEGMKRSFEKLKKRISDIAKQIKDPIAQAQSKVKKFSLDLMSFSSFSIPLPTLRFELLKNYDFSFLNPLKNIKNGLKTAKNLVSIPKNTAKHIYYQTKKWMEPGIKWAGSQLERVRKKLTQAISFFEKQGKKGSQKIKEAFSYIGKKVSKHVKAAQNKVSNRWHHFLHWLKETVWPWICKKMPFIPKSIQFVQKSYRKVVKTIQTNFNFFKIKINAFHRKFRNQLIQYRLKAISFFKRELTFLNILKVLVSSLNKLKKRMGYFFSYSLWFIKAVFKSIQLLFNELSLEMGSWFKNDPKSS